MRKLAYYNGQFGEYDKIRVPLSDRSIFFGDGVYDAAIGCYDRILWEDEHIERLLDNARRLGIKHEYTKDRLSGLLREVAVKSQIDSYFIYFSLTRNMDRRIHSAKNCNTANILVTIEEFNLKPNSAPLKLITCEDKRYEYCDIKTINLLPSVLASTEAEICGCDEAVLHRGEIVTECAKSNISILLHGRIKTHPISNHILPGITRKHLLTVARQYNIPCDESPFTLKELFEADEIIVSSTSKLCRRVCSVDGISVGGKSGAISDLLCSKIYDTYLKICYV